MRHLVAAVLLAASGLAAGQGLIEFRRDLAFDAAEVNAVAARAFGARLVSLEISGQLDSSDRLEKRFQRLFPRLLAAAALERPDALRMPWELHACTRCEENAMAMAGGKLLVSVEFVERLGLDDDELAYLVAHEMGHVLAEHTREFAGAARHFMSNGMRRYYADIQQELDDNLTLQLRMAPVAARQELHADHIGFILGARAGYEPRAMLSLLDKLGGGASLFRTHPDHTERVAHARAMLETARRLAAAHVER